jgi:hypothetical protein
MQAIGFSVRFISSFIWFQIYRLGVSSDIYQPAEFESRSGFSNPPSPVPARQISIDENVLGGSIYDPAYYSSLFQDKQDLGSSYEVSIFCISEASLEVCFSLHAIIFFVCSYYLYQKNKLTCMLYYGKLQG